MYWKNNLDHILIAGTSHKLPAEVSSSGLPEFVQDFILLTEFSAVIDIFADFNVCSIYDELWYTGIYYLEDDKLIQANWSCVSCENPRIAVEKRVISSGWEAVDETSLNSNHVKSAKYFNKDTAVFRWAFSEGIRSNRLDLK